MKAIGVFFLMLVAAASAQADPATPPGPSHPLVGTWSWTIPDGSCTETYTFRADGTSFVTSGHEVAESAFAIDPRPGANGFYKFTDTVTKDNGKRDCVGQETGSPVGKQVTRYVHFDLSGQAFIMCQSELLDACFGPLRKVPAEEL